MKRLAFLIILVLTGFAGMTAYGAAVAITSPPDGLVVPAGYELRLKISGGADSVRLYDNGGLIAELDPADAAAGYSIPGGLPEGVHTFTAQSGGETSQPVSVTATVMDEYVLTDADFEDSSFNCVLPNSATGAEGEVVHNGGELFEIPGANLSFQHHNFDRVAAVDAPIDAAGNGGGKAILIERNGENAGTTKLFYLLGSGSSYKPAKSGFAVGPKQRLLIEFDMYTDAKAEAKSGNFTFVNELWCNATSKSNSLTPMTFNNQGNLSASGAEESFGWTEATWHSYKIYVDTDSKIMDLYIDGRRIVTQCPITLADTFDETGIASIRFRLSPTSNQKIYMDNIKFAVLTTPPRIGSLAFIGADGEEITSSGVPCDIKSIKLVSTAMANVSSLYGHISLVWEENSKQYNIPFEYTATEGMTEAYTIELPYKLRRNAKYSVIVDPGFADSSGEVNNSQQVLTFTTNPPSSYVKSVEYKGQTAEITFVNGESSPVTIKAAAAVYTGGRLTGMSYQNLEAASGESVNAVSLPDGEEVKVYVWSNDFVPYYVN